MDWEPPAWAEGKSIDQQVSEYCRRTGQAQPVEGPTVTVEIAQLEEIDRMAVEPVVVRSDPVLRINGVRFRLDQAAALNEAIGEALRLLR
jgi:hypothetical protein